MIPFLPPFSAPEFPPTDQALTEPDGLLAAGGNLSPDWLLAAYRRGIFPWFGEGDPILWWCPDPRTVFATDHIHLSTRFRRRLRKLNWEARFDQGFDSVIESCALIPRPGQSGTWITASMRAAYKELHRRGYAHCTTVYADGQIIGGLYGVALGRMFFAESMFSAVSGASKFALAALADLLHRHHFPLIDAQLDNPHLHRLGAKRLIRAEFLQQVEQLTSVETDPRMWSERISCRKLVAGH